jgi:hypothetical protein
MTSTDTPSPDYGLQSSKTIVATPDSGGMVARADGAAAFAVDNIRIAHYVSSNVGS